MNLLCRAEPAALFHPLKELVAHDGIILRHLQNCRVFVDRQALVSDRLYDGVVGLVSNTFLFRGRRLGQFLFEGALDGQTPS